MPNLVVLTKEADLEIDYLAEFQRTKKVRQNLFYTMHGAQSFYTYRGEDFDQIRWEDEYEFFRQQTFWCKDANVAIVSLGCGNAHAEKLLMHAGWQDGLRITFLGVDSSRTMLELAQANLADEPYPSKFMLADFTSDVFRDYCAQALADFDIKIFTMMGGTYGNFNQYHIMNVLKSVIPVDAYFYLDVVPQYATDSQNEALWARLSKLPDNFGAFFDNVLEKLCIERDKGSLYGVQITDDDPGAIGYTFFYEARIPLAFPCFGGTMRLEPGERIELLSIRAYQPAALQEYFEKHDFQFRGAYVPDVGNLKHLWQRFLFQRKRT